MFNCFEGGANTIKSVFSCDCSVVHREAVDEVSGKMLDEEIFDRLSGFFKVLGDNTRVKIMWALDNHELCVCDIANLLNMTKSAVSHQLGMLRRAKLVKFRKSGKTVYYSIADEHVRLMLESGFEHITELD